MQDIKSSTTGVIEDTISPYIIFKITKSMQPAVKLEKPDINAKIISEQIPDLPLDQQTKTYSQDKKDDLKIY